MHEPDAGDMRQDRMAGSTTPPSVDLAGAARDLARALDHGATTHASAVGVPTAWAHEVPNDVAPAAYEVADDAGALDLLTRAAILVTARRTA
jgi:hypothetical protein